MHRGLTGPMGMPVPPSLMSRCSSSSTSSTSTASWRCSSLVNELSESSAASCATRFSYTCGCGCAMFSPVEPGGCTAPDVSPSVSESGRSCFVGVGGTITSASTIAGMAIGVRCGGVTGARETAFSYSHSLAAEERQEKKEARTHPSWT